MTNHFLYHIVRKDLFGKTLYPLNQLKNVNPDLYIEHNSKYANRKHITELYIPQLQCYWGDVIHLSAVHPNTVIQKLHEAGSTKQYSYPYFEIDPHQLDPSSTVVYPNNPRENPNQLTEKDFVPYDPEDIRKWAYIPEETFEYYKSQIMANKDPLLFLFVPHILYKGTIDVSGLTLQKTT